MPQRWVGLGAEISSSENTSPTEEESAHVEATLHHVGIETTQKGCAASRFLATLLSM